MRRLLFAISVMVLLVFACVRGTPGLTPGREVVVGGKSYKVITVTQLRSMLDNKDFLLVNVHIPYAGEINGTDMFVPYNEIEQNLSKLPADKSARIVLYCQSGVMSSLAAKTLTGLGYTSVMDVNGGMMAWQKEGYQIVQAPK